jgi:hypothetical protein
MMGLQALGEISTVELKKREHAARLNTKQGFSFSILPLLGQHPDSFFCPLLIEVKKKERNTLLTRAAGIGST